MTERNATMTTAENTEPFVESFSRGRDDLPGRGLVALRENAIRSFADAGFPTPRAEAWKYTNLNRLTRAKFDPLAEVRPVDAARWTGFHIDGAHRIVIANGRYDAAASELGDLPEGAVVAPLSEAIDLAGEDLASIATAESGSLVALNTAFMRDGLVLRLEKGVVLDRPVQVLYVVDAGDTAMSLHPHTLILAGEGSAATVVETFAGAAEAGYWTNAVTEIRVAANAEIVHLKRQSEAASGYHTALTQVRLACDARYNGVSLAAGGVLSRNELRVSFDGEGADCALSGATLLRGRQHADNTTGADHRVPHTSSRQVFRNVLDEHARAVFQGCVIVREHAQKTDSNQSSRSLLLAPGAQADTKPELRIFADDVKCAHGATVGDLDRDALFYLESRGVPPAEAKALLIQAFVDEVFEAVPEGALRGHFTDAIGDWMEGGR